MLSLEQLPSKVEQIESKLDNALELLSKLSPQKKKQRLTVTDASQLTGYSKSTIYGKVSRNEIPYRKLGAKVWFNSDELETWIENGK